MMSKKIIILGVLSVFFFVVIASGIYLFLFKKPASQLSKDQTQITQKKPSYRECLEENDMVEYDRISFNPVITQPKESSPTIFIKNKKTGGIRNSFQVENIVGVGHPMEIHRCGVYAIRGFEFDKKKGIYKKYEFWKYTYNENKEILLPNEEFRPYSLDFRIDPLENYIALIKYYLGHPDYALVIKNSALEDIFTLSIIEIEKRNSDLVQDISLNGWTKEGHYFWAHTHYGANTLGFIRIDSQDWRVDLFPAPKDVLGGDALNLENGYVTVHSKNIWIGVAELEEEEKIRRRAQGIGTELYIENLITGERHFVTKTNEPLWYFKPKWVSETALEYQLPSGEKKVYKIK